MEPEELEEVDVEELEVVLEVEVEELDVEELDVEELDVEELELEVVPPTPVVAFPLDPHPTPSAVQSHVAIHRNCAICAGMSLKIHKSERKTSRKCNDPGRLRGGRKYAVSGRFSLKVLRTPPNTAVHHE